jgi:hypothetical protein
MKQSTQKVRLSYFAVDAAAEEEPWSEEAAEDAEPPEDEVDAVAEENMVILNLSMLNVVEI